MVSNVAPPSSNPTLFDRRETDTLAVFPYDNHFPTFYENVHPSECRDTDFRLWFAQTKETKEIKRQLKVWNSSENFSRSYLKWKVQSMWCRTPTHRICMWTIGRQSTRWPSIWEGVFRRLSWHTCRLDRRLWKDQSHRFWPHNRRSTAHCEQPNLDGGAETHESHHADSERSTKAKRRCCDGMLTFLEWMNCMPRHTWKAKLIKSSVFNGVRTQKPESLLELDASAWL